MTARFPTLTGEDWKRSLTAARQRFATTSSRIRSQIPANRLMPTTPPALYSGEIPASEVIAQLKAKIEAMTEAGTHLYCCASRKNKARWDAAVNKAPEIHPLYVVTHEGAKPILYAALEADMARIDKLESLALKLGQTDWRITTAPNQQHRIAIRTGHNHAFSSLRDAIDAIDAIDPATPPYVHPDTARLDDLLNTINVHGTLAISDRYEFGINLPLDRKAIDDATT